MNSDFERFLPWVLLVSPFILAILFGIFGNYFIFFFYLLIIVSVGCYYVYKFIKGDVNRKRSILQMVNLDFSKQRYDELRNKEIEKNVVHFLINAIEVSPYINEGGFQRRWEGDQWRLVDGMRIYLEELDWRKPTYKAYIYRSKPNAEDINKSRPISIIYKNNVPSIQYYDIRDQRYYQYDMYRAFAKEIVDRHLISRELDSIFEDPIPKSCDLTPVWERRKKLMNGGNYFEEPSESKRKAQEDEWKEKRDLYKSFWENPLNFKYEGDWWEDKDFPRFFATKLWKRYCQPLPSEFYEGWENK